MDPSEESRLIFEALQSQGLGMKLIPGDRVYPGLSIDGKVAIIEMKEAGYSSWRQMEWPAYFISFLLEKTLVGTMEIIKKRMRTCFKGDYIWDVRVKSIDSKSSWVILTDVRHIDEIFDLYDGFGLIIIKAQFEYDNDGTFREWLEDLKGGPSEYTLKIEREGRKPRRRKKEVFLIRGDAYYFPTFNEFLSGIDSKWLDNDFARTMRNSNELSRNPKYAINEEQIPPHFSVGTYYFNVDLEDFSDEIFMEND